MILRPVPVPRNTLTLLGPSAWASPVAAAANPVGLPPSAPLPRSVHPRGDGYPWSDPRRPHSEPPRQQAAIRSRLG